MGVVIRRWVWLEFIGVVSGCFPHISYISLLHLYLFFFAAASLLLFHFVKMIFRSLNTYLQLRASHGTDMKAAHTVLYMKKHTQTYASYPTMDISCMSVV